MALRSGFDDKKHLRIKFIGEPAVDGGGPRREYFMLLMGDIANNGAILDGPPDRRVLRHNISAFEVFIVVFWYMNSTITNKLFEYGLSVKLH